MPFTLAERETRQANIDAKLANLVGVARSCREERNAFAAISTLPTEILSQIFQWLVYWRCFSPRGRYIGDQDVFKHDLRPITHVCRCWRQTALGSPNLWSCLFHRDTSVSYELLGRAKGAPLYIFLDADHADDVWNLGIQAAPRVHTYLLDLNGNNLDIDCFLKLSRGPSLSYIVEMRLYFEDEVQHTIIECLNSSLFPRLQHLKLEDCTVLAMLSTLQRLISYEDSYSRTLQDTLGFVSEHPQLQELTVSTEGGFSELDPQFPPPMTLAPCLQRLRVMEHALLITCCELLESLACAHTRLSLGIFFDDAPLEVDTQRFVDSVMKVIGMYMKNCKTIAFTIYGGVTNFLLAEQVSSHRRAQGILDSVDFEDDTELIVCFTSRDKDHLRAICYSMIRHTCQSSIETLEVALDAKQLNFWLEFVPSLTCLKYLTLGSKTGHNILKMIMSKQDDRVLPALREVFLRFIIVGNADLSERRSVSYEMVRDWVVKRAEQQMPLSLLSIASTMSMPEFMKDVPVSKFVG